MTRSNKLAGACTLLLVFMILCDEVSVSEARHLKCKKFRCEGSHGNSYRSTSASSSSGRMITSSSRNEHAEVSFKARNHGRDQPLTKEELASEMEETSDDFRPTAPGRSPGAGH